MKISLYTFNSSSQFLSNKNISLLFIGIFILTFFGFYNSYFQYFPFLEGQVSWSVHFHALFMMLWLLIVILQPLLISLGKPKFHRIIGANSWVLVLLIVISTVLLIVEKYNHALIEGVPLISNVAIRLVSVITLVSFVTFYIQAIRYRKKMAVHLRYIIGTSLTVVPASAARILYFLKINSVIAELLAIALVNLVVFTLMVRDAELGVELDEKPYHVVLGFQLVLLTYYCLLLGVSYYFRQ